MTLASSSIVHDVLEYVGAFFVIYLIGYSSFLFLSVMVGATTLWRRKREVRFRSELDVDCYVPLSVIVPAHDEALTVVDSVHSLLSLDYSLYEVVIVDDGSTDDTANRLIEAFGLHRVELPVRMALRCAPLREAWAGRCAGRDLTLVRKDNGGKADALNMGINVSRYPYYVCIDADSVLQVDSLTRITAPIVEGRNVVAVGGLVRPSNGIRLREGRVASYSLPRRVVPAMQVLEYDRSFLSARILLDKFNGNLIISGAFGAFRKDVVVAAGGYDPTTVGEDMELVTRLHAFCRANGMDYRIRYAPDAICWSQAPDTLRDLVRQRRRWHRGLFECMLKHRRLLANPRYGAVGLVSYLYYLVYELLSPAIELVGLAATLLAAAYGYVNVPFMLAFFGIYAVFGAVMSLTAFFSRVHTRDLRLSVSDVVRAVGLSVVEVTLVRLVLAVTRLLALVGHRRRGRVWERAERRRMDVGGPDGGRDGA